MIAKMYLAECIYIFFVTKGIALYIFLSAFSFFFCLSYTVALLGTCINFFFVNLHLDQATKRTDDYLIQENTYIVKILKKYVK